MLIIPAIDLLNGECVRLTQGNYAQKTVYSGNPLAAASSFEQEGVPMLHLVDLDGAKTGKPRNQEMILQIAKQVRIPVEVGGGLRDFNAIENYLKEGIRRVVLGTKALDFHFLKRCLEKFGPDKIVVGLDLRDGKIALEGWVKTSSLSLQEFVDMIKKMGVRHIIHTDVYRDGTLSQPNFEVVQFLLGYGLNVVVAGGVADLKSIERLRDMGVYGVILGKAIYEKKISLREALSRSLVSQLTKRIIPCLDVKDGRVVKGVKFLDLKDAGDPVELGKRYSEESADELVFLDIAASLENRKTMIELVEKVAREVFIPFTVGGGIQSAEEIRKLLHAGADKVSINTAAMQNPSLISEASSIFGSQCIVVAMDAKRQGDVYKVFIKGGREETSWEVLDWAKEVEKRGAGEILLTSMDRDGTRKGFDLDLVRKVSESVKIPVIASGGAGSLQDLLDACATGKADAVLIASLFHYHEFSISQVKEYLRSQGVAVRV